MILRHVDVLGKRVIHTIDTTESRGDIEISLNDGRVLALKETDNGALSVHSKNGPLIVAPIVSNVFNIEPVG